MQLDPPLSVSPPWFESLTALYYCSFQIYIQQLPGCQVSNVQKGSIQSSDSFVGPDYYSLILIYMLSYSSRKLCWAFRALLAASCFTHVCYLCTTTTTTIRTPRQCRRLPPPPSREDPPVVVVCFQWVCYTIATLFTTIKQSVISAQWSQSVKLSHYFTMCYV